MKDVIVFGPTPEPNGGVSSYIQDAFRLYGDCIAFIVDIYPGRKQVASEDVYRPTGKILFRIFKAWFFICKRKEKKLYLNFSTFNALALSFFLCLNFKKIYLTFHNGRIGKVSSFSRLFICLLNIRSVNFIALSDQQMDTLKLAGAKKIVKMDLYRKACILPIEERVRLFEKKLKNSSKITFMISGYPTHIYQHQQFIKEFFEWKKKGRNAQLICCLYGDDSDGILGNIRKICSQSAHIDLHEGLDRKRFRELLESSDIYVRSNSIDSYGIVVKEALECGKLVFATSVCRRTPGSYIFTHNRIQDVFCAVDNLCYGEAVTLPISDLPESFLTFPDVFE